MHERKQQRENSRKPSLYSAANADDGGEEGLLVGHVVAADEDVLPVAAVEGQLGLLQREFPLDVILVVRSGGGGRVQLEGGDRGLGRLAVRVRTTYAENLHKRR